jgi:signal transduction histidine kinase
MLNHELRLAFYELGEEDRKNLSHLRPLLEKGADSLVAAFYRHLLSFQDTRQLLADPEVKDRLLVKQREYLLSLADPGLDAEYLAQRLAIGRTHVRVGLEPRYYLGAYSLYLRLLVPAILENWQQEPALAERMILSLEKVLMFDASVAVDSYIARREERLSFLNQELASTSRDLERRFEAEHERSREATARARAAEQLVSLATLVAALAHEIGTPMGVIRGHAELLESSVSDERGRKRLQTIRDQIDRISHIIQTLLNMARPGGRDTGPVDVCALARETLAFLAEKIRAHAIEARVELPARAMVRGSFDKLQQILINLVINAVDAMPDGGKLIVRVDADSLEWVAIRITDTGQGMSPETQARIFEPFFSTKAPGRGSGLGLVVAREIASDHGGTLEVTSAVGQGTEFVLTLPRLAQSDAPVKSGT